MFFLVQTVIVRINDVRLSVRVCHAVKGFVKGREVWCQISERKTEKSLMKDRKRKKFFKRTRSGFSTRQFVQVFKIDSSLVFHVHLRAPLTSPGKIDSNVLPDSGSDKRRSPNPPSHEVSSGQLLELSQESNSQQTSEWLRLNNFCNYVTTFANFNGADILRLTKDDLIRICGLADGIRLLNALHSKAILTLYISNPSSAAFGAYYAVYLNNTNRSEMFRKLAALVGVQQSQIHDVFLQGPNDIRIVVTDEVVGHLEDESIFSIELLKDESRGRFILLLKPAPSSA